MILAWASPFNVKIDQLRIILTDLDKHGYHFKAILMEIRWLADTSHSPSTIKWIHLDP